MRPKTMLMLLVAVGCGIVAAVGSTFLGRAAPDNRVKIFVAKSNLTAGTSIKDPNTMFELKPYAPDQKPQAAIDNMEKLKGKMLARSLSANSPVLETDLREGGGLQPPTGMVAVAIRADQEKTAGGFVYPGARVDVIASRKGPNSRPIVRTILQNMQVLAVNQATEVPEGNKTIVPTTVTLAVKPKEAEDLHGYRETSTLSLALRGSGDEDVRPVEPDEDLVKILVASMDIDANTVLDEPLDYFEEKEVLESKKPHGAIVNFEVLRGKKIKAIVTKGSPITGKDLMLDKEEPKPVESVVVKAPPKVFTMTIISGGMVRRVAFPEGGEGAMPDEAPLPLAPGVQPPVQPAPPVTPPGLSLPPLPPVLQGSNGK